MYSKLPKELIILIYLFDQTYREKFNLCMDEFNQIIIKREERINNINRDYWNKEMPLSVKNYYLQSKLLINYIKFI
jgi:hypothetical protein